MLREQESVLCGHMGTKKEHNRVAYPASLKKRCAQAAVPRDPGPAVQQAEVHRQPTSWP